jgi:hypothetical protein
MRQVKVVDTLPIGVSGFKQAIYQPQLKKALQYL